MNKIGGLHSSNKIMSRLKIKILTSKTGGLHSVNKIMSHFKIALRCLQFHADLETRRRFSLNFGLACLHLHLLVTVSYASDNFSYNRGECKIEIKFLKFCLP